MTTEHPRPPHNGVFEQAPVKQFICDEILGRVNFNEHATAGAHAHFMVRAAKSAGLTVRKIGVGHFFFDAKKCIGTVEAMIPSLVSHAALKAGRSKQLTKELLSAAGVPVPRGQLFAETDQVKGARFFRALEATAVVKPDGGRGGVGVTCGVSTAGHFKDAWQRAAATTKQETAIMVEEFTMGIDLRVYVVDGKAVAAASRIPAHVIGDGLSSVSELLSEKQGLRERNRYLERMPIVVDPQWMLNSGHSMDQVLEAGEIAVLNSTVNLHQGGENIDVTGMLHPELGAIAVAALDAIPGMGAGGVDFVAKSPRTAEGAVVLEVNTGANISVHHLPAYGEPVNVGRAIIDAMIARGVGGAETPPEVSPESLAE
jgi:D-alanine-D-alanine ligase-like ATP-grasp enzyme